MEYFQAKTVTTRFKRPLSDLNKAHKHIILKNGLSALLISDPLVKIAACSMCVKSGSHRDPDELPGLAHFCEHMVFMGTSDYPTPNELVNTVTSVGGNCNAYTTGDKTCFFFEMPISKAEINNELCFNYTLKVFSSMFNLPLFSEAYMDMEINSVHHEHELNLLNDNKILYHGFRLLSNDNHPFSRFATGSKDTLKSSRHVKLKSELEKYFRQNFYAENLGLVLRGPQSLNQLQKLAISNFLNIRKFTSIENKFAKEVPRYGNEEIFNSTNKILFIKQDDVSQLRLFFPMYGVTNSFYESIWCNLLGDESTGSICHFLRDEKQYIQSLYLFTQELSFENRVIVIDAPLTKKGESKLNFIIEAIFVFVNQILETEIETMTSVLREYSRIFKFNAYFSLSETLPMEEVSDLAIELHNIHKNVEDIILGDAFRFSGDAKAFKYATRYVFNINKLNVVLLGSELPVAQSIAYSGLTSLEKDPNYMFSYQIFDLKFQTKHGFPYFSVLRQNDYLNFSHEELDEYIEQSMTNTTVGNVLLSTKMEPRLLDSSNFHEIWFSKTARSSTRIITSFQIFFETMDCTPINTLGMEILVELLAEELTPEFYHSELAMYSWGIYPNYTLAPSLSVFLCGPGHGFMYFIEMFLKKMNTFFTEKIRKVGYKRFKNAKLKLLEKYNDLEDADSMKQATVISILVLEKGIFPLEDRIDALELIDIDKVIELGSQISTDAKKVKVLISGSINEAMVFQICNSVNKITSHLRIYMKRIDFPEPQSIFLRPGRNYTITRKNSNEKDISDVVYHYIQLGLRNDKKARNIASFLSSLLVQNVSFALRTKKQLGYFVLSGLRYNKETFGVYICISSGNFTYEQVMKEIENLLFEWELRLLNSSQEEIASQVDSFLELDEKESDITPSNILYATPPTRCSGNFGQNEEDYIRHQDYWEKIVTKNYRFSGVKGNESVDRAYLKTIPAAEILSYFKRNISIKSKERSTFSVFISSHIGRINRKFEDGKEILEELLAEKGYKLTDIQVTTLIREHNNDISSAIKYLQKCGYRISFKPMKRTSKIMASILSKAAPMDNTKEVQKLQNKCIKRFGNIYNDSNPILPYTEVRSKEEIHCEAIEFY